MPNSIKGFDFSILCHPYIIRMSLVCTCMPSVCHSCLLTCHLYITRMHSDVIHLSFVCTRMLFVCHLYVVLPRRKPPLNEVQLRDVMCKWFCKRMAKPKVQKLWNGVSKSISLNIFLTYSARKMVSCPSINFCFEFVERRRILWSLVEDPIAYRV